MMKNIGKPMVAVAGGIVLGSLAFMSIAVFFDNEKQQSIAEKAVEPEQEAVTNLMLDSQADIDELIALEEETPLIDNHAVVANSDDSMLVAIDSYVNDFNVSKEEAKRRLLRQIPLSNEMQKIVATEGKDRVAAWSIDHGEDLKGWVMLVGDSPIQLDSQNVLIENPDIEIRYNALHTLKELEDTQSTIDLKLQQSIADNTIPAEIQEAIAYTDLSMEENRLTVALNEEWSTESWTTKEEMLESVQLYFDTQFNVPVTVVFDVAPANTALIRGGDPLNSCTAGFAVRDKRNSARRGLLTAGHCSNYQSSRALYKASRAREGGAVDVQFHEMRPGNILSRYTRLNSATTRRDTTRKMTRVIRRENMHGISACKQGKVTGTTCGRVTSIHLSYRSNRNVNHNHMVKIEGPSLRSCSGDSGGPVWTSSIALGINSAKGGSASDCSARGTRWISYGNIITALYYMNAYLYK